MKHHCILPHHFRYSMTPAFFACLLMIPVFGACGGESTDSPYRKMVILNEISCHNRDWVEIVNITADEIDIGSWAIADDLNKKGHQYAIPEGTFIQPGEHLVVRQEMDLEEGFAFGLKCGEDIVYILDAGGAVVDQVTLGEVSDDSTWGHLPDITGLWRETAPSEGKENEESPSS